MENEFSQNDNDKDEPAQSHTDEFATNITDNVGSNTQSFIKDINTEPELFVQPTIIATTPPPDPVKPEVNSPGVIVLQWLTYAFWGWTVIAMSVLTSIVLAHFMLEDANVGESIIYGIAAIIVLLPVSVICDIFYSKKEPEKKTGFASVVMVIHAVIFGLSTIGALITVAFSVANLIISSSSSEETQVVLFSALIITILSVAVLLRTIMPKRLLHMRRCFIIFMMVAVGIIITLGIVGPVSETWATRNDRLIQENIYSVESGIDNYVTSNKKLPNSLSDVELTGDAKKLVQDNLVTYKNDGEASEGSGYLAESYYRYQLCVTYQKASDNNWMGGSSSSHMEDTNSSGYETSVSTYYHKAGETCYKLKIPKASSYVYGETTDLTQ
jgi:hypothetical protein